MVSHLRQPELLELSSLTLREDDLALIIHAVYQIFLQAVSICLLLIFQIIHILL